jgi:hypothetical protein
LASRSVALHRLLSDRGDRWRVETKALEMEMMVALEMMVEVLASQHPHGKHSGRMIAGQPLGYQLVAT